MKLLYFGFFFSCSWPKTSRSFLAQSSHFLLLCYPFPKKKKKDLTKPHCLSLAKVLTWTLGEQKWVTRVVPCRTEILTQKFHFPPDTQQSVCIGNINAGRRKIQRTYILLACFLEQFGLCQLVRVNTVLKHDSQDATCQENEDTRFLQSKNVFRLEDTSSTILFVLTARECSQVL